MKLITISPILFWGADNVPYHYENDVNAIKVWLRCKDWLHSFGFDGVRMSWKGGKLLKDGVLIDADTYQDHFRPFRALGPLADFLGAKQRILLFDGTEPFKPDALKARVKESYDWFKARLGSTMPIQTGGEVEAPEKAYAAFEQAELVRKATGASSSQVYLPAILVMPGVPWKKTLALGFPRGKRIGTLCFDVYVDASLTPQSMVEFRKLLDGIEIEAAKLGYSKSQIAITEYGSCPNYAAGFDIGAMVREMRTEVESRGYRLTCAYIMQDTTGPKAFGWTTPDAAISAIGAGQVTA